MKLLFAWDQDTFSSNVFDLTAEDNRLFNVKCQFKNFQKVWEIDFDLTKFKGLEVYNDRFKGYCFKTTVDVFERDNLFGDMTDDNNYKFLKTETYKDRLEKFIHYDSMADKIYFELPKAIYIISSYYYDDELTNPLRYSGEHIELQKNETKYNLIKNLLSEI